MTRDYVLDQGFAQERARLSGMAPGATALGDSGVPHHAQRPGTDGAGVLV